MDNKPNLGIAAPSFLPGVPVGMDTQTPAAYADIVAVSGPTQAAEGSWVNFDVAVKNIWTGSFYVAVTGQYDGNSILPSIDYLLIAPGETLHFYFAFQMPAYSIDVFFWSFYWSGSEWVVDDIMGTRVALSVLKPEFSGFAIKEYVKI